MPVGNTGSTMCAELNRLANAGTYPARTAFLDEQGAANKWAGTVGKSLVAALNIKNGVTNPSLFKNLGAVCNALAGTTGKSPLAALTSMAGIAPPGTPTIGTATTPSPTTASVAFTAADATATSFVATSSPGGITGTATSSPITVSGLTTGTAYTFTVYASNEGGNSAASAASNSVTPSNPRFIIGGMTSSPWLAAYAWDDTSGWGAQYSAPTGMPADRPDGLRMNTGNTWVGVVSGQGAGTTNAVGAYPWSASTGFGTRVATTSTTDQYFDCAFHPNNDAFITVKGTANVQAWQWSNSTGFGTAYSNWTQPADSQFGIAFNNAGTAVVVGTRASMYLAATQWSSSTGFGTNYSASGLTSWGIVPRFSPQGTSLVVGTRTTTPADFGIVAMPWNDSSGFGTRFSNPSSYTLAQTSHLSFNSTGTVVFLGGSSSPHTTAYAYSNSTGIGTKFANPTTIFGGENASMVNSTNTAVLGAGTGSSTKVNAWNNTTGWGSAYAAPSPNVWSASTTRKPIFN